MVLLSTVNKPAGFYLSKFTVLFIKALFFMSQWYGWLECTDCWVVLAQLSRNWKPRWFIPSNDFLIFMKIFKIAYSKSALCPCFIVFICALWLGCLVRWSSSLNMSWVNLYIQSLYLTCAAAFFIAVVSLLSLRSCANIARSVYPSSSSLIYIASFLFSGDLCTAGAEARGLYNWTYFCICLDRKMSPYLN